MEGASGASPIPPTPRPLPGSRRSEPGLPVVRHDGEARELRLLVDHRDDLVTQ
jgi:hypothetical protein